MRKAHGARLKICGPKIYFNAVADNRLLQNCGEITAIKQGQPLRHAAQALRRGEGFARYPCCLQFTPRPRGALVGRGAHTVAAPSSWRLPVLVPLLLGPHCGQLCSKQHRP